MQAQGRTSRISRFNLPGRYAWCVSELVSPLNVLYILTTLPSRIQPISTTPSPSSLLGTGLPFWNELLAALFVIHYTNRAVIAPLYLAPSMSPIHISVFFSMSFFNFVNSSCIAAWLCYSPLPIGSNPSPTSSTALAIGLALFAVGLYGNVACDTTLFALRRGAAKRKARSEGRATVTYDKVYAIPPAEGWFRYVLYPHYVMEWVEWLGYAIVGYGAGMGFWKKPSMWFLVNEVAVMLPRAKDGKNWYEGKFGKKALAGRGGSLPGGWL
ncbi:MAG: hypothetical protein Q9160_008920 [Pyrenula sp. 1 TL-2023]